ncbi:uncharacterized protein H6S33_005991 [Morchella sextelata]|uniref:uncharacterized protein n=1 Tax=Morchella sextelata TaxID=1174677 RepID=UPI001D03F558|nr:uncharacterized protein H6S33_005991 [Morchella sextelata]KAH0614105.1 hypothetical protein H6S33_005991 [Morchella sextelata]
MYLERDTQFDLHDGCDPIFDPSGEYSGLGMEEIEFGHSKIIAVITVYKGAGGRRVSVQYHDLAGIAVPCPIKDVQSYHYVPSCLGGAQRPGDPSSECKMCLKMQKSLNRFFSFISGKNTIDGRTTTSRGTALLTIGESGMVERYEVKGKKGGDGKSLGEGIMNFQCFAASRVFQLPYEHPASEKFEYTGPDTIQYFNLRSSNLKVKDKIEEFSSVDIVSGTCLFSQEYLGNTTQRSPDNLPPRLSDQRPTLYEIESLVRLPNAIADVVSALPDLLHVTITLDIPKFQYYLFFVDLYSEGHCNREYINSQLGAIDQRHNQVAEVFVKAIEEELNRRGVIDRRNIQIKVRGGLIGIAPYIRNSINQGHSVPSVQSLLQRAMDLDPQFRKYCEFLPQPPQDHLSLGGISYPYEVLRPILRRHIHEQGNSNIVCFQQKRAQGRQLLIQIDNKNERRTYVEASRILKEYRTKSTISSAGDPLLIGMFPIERIFTAEKAGKTSLYYSEAGHHIYDSSVKAVVSPSDVVGRVYGKEATGRVVGWMKKKGMQVDMPATITTSNI